MPTEFTAVSSGRPPHRYSFRNSQHNRNSGFKLSQPGMRHVSRGKFASEKLSRSDCIPCESLVRNELRGRFTSGTRRRSLTSTKSGRFRNRFGSSTLSSLELTTSSCLYFRVGEGLGTLRRVLKSFCLWMAFSTSANMLSSDRCGTR